MFYDMFFNIFFYLIGAEWHSLPVGLKFWKINRIRNQFNTYKLLWMILME